MSGSTQVFTETLTFSPTSLLRLPFPPDPTAPSQPEDTHGLSTGIVLAVVGGASLFLAGFIGLGIMLCLRRRTRLRSEARMREERAIWREGAWTSISDLDSARSRSRPELKEKRVSSSSSFSSPRVYIHPATASWSPPPSPPVPTEPTFPRSRPMQDIPSDAASFNTFSASVIYLPPPIALSARSDAGSEHSLPFVAPEPVRVTRTGMGAEGSGRWD